MVAWLGPMTLAIGSAHLKRLTQECNFELVHQGDRLRIRHGLTDLRTTTVPIHRIQAVEVSQSLPWRLPGWWRIQVNVAGAGAGDDETQTVLMPVGNREEALRVLTLVHPGIPRGAALAALEGEGAAEGFVTSTERARRFDPLSWRRQGYAVLPDGLLTRRGALYRAAQFVPHARIQSLKVEQGRCSGAWRRHGEDRLHGRSGVTRRRPPRRVRRGAAAGRAGGAFQPGPPAGLRAPQRFGQRPSVSAPRTGRRGPWPPGCWSAAPRGRPT